MGSAVCKQITTTVPHTSDPEARRVGPLLVRDYLLDNKFFLFTKNHVGKTIKDLKNSTAAGSDDLAMLHQMHLRLLGLQKLTKLYNLSMLSDNIPLI